MIEFLSVTQQDEMAPYIILVFFIIFLSPLFFSLFALRRMQILYFVEKHLTAILIYFIKTNYKTEGKSLNFYYTVIRKSSLLLKSESIRKYVKEYFTKPQDIKRSLLYFNANAEYYLKLELLTAMLKIAYSDLILEKEEEDAIRKICKYIGLKDDTVSAYIQQFEKTAKPKRKQREEDEKKERQKQQAFYDFINRTSKIGLKSAYDILGITESASNRELKKAYRNLVKKYHPDKLANADAASIMQAQEQFRKITEAYERIKKQRGIA